MNEKSNLLHVIQRVQGHTQRLMMRMNMDEIIKKRPTTVFMELIAETGSAYQKDLLDLGYIIEEDEGIRATKNGAKFLREIRNKIIHNEKSI
ncbi:hypothetical protein V2W64_14615 [Acinetobacter baumannii]|nr:hypothetical protein [Acinetobacter baumannii]